MSLDVLLINPPSTEETPSVPHEVGEPIGLCYLAAALRHRGFSAEVLDGFTLGLSVHQLVELTHAYHPRLCVGISVLETSALASAKYVRELRASGFDGHICAGNYYPTLNPERTFELAPNLDSIIRGEGEQVFTDLVDHLRRGSRDWQTLQGVCHLSDGRFVNNGIAPQPAIDEILEPVRDCLPQTLDAGGTANLVTGRGCYANCSFCSIVAFTGAAGKRFRVRSEDLVVQEISRISQNYEVQRFLIPDDNFMLPGKHRAPRVHRLCDAIDSRRLKVEFTITCRTDDIHDDLVGRLKASGLVGVYVGIESFLPRRLKLFNKCLQPESNFRALAILDENSVFVKMGFIMFDPFSTVEEVIQELEILRDRVGCPTVVHTSIDNLIRHSTSPLELQAGTPIQKKMSMLGRAFEVGAGFDYFFDSPIIYALSRFAAGLLRFEGPTFAPLRALSYRLCFGKPLEKKLHAEVDQACTRLWKKFGTLHFACYVEVVRSIGLYNRRESAPVILTIQQHAKELQRLRIEALELVRFAGFTDLERPWIRYVDLDRERMGQRRVYDPATSSWHQLEVAECAALMLWSRTPVDDVQKKLEHDFGVEVATRAIKTISSKVESGHFAAKREMEAPLHMDEFTRLIEEIMSELKAGRVGPRLGDLMTEREPQSTGGAKE